ncbi:MAG: hypothetical protein KKE86_10540 [Planctomycetes bacterium]|nr:hypothetical protein [Planctomycetota bacterium]MBU4399758.1 hypothetical protein [Planctomycetota bacterium]MCG2684649.1 hypothetical protein [Planctomycetales bacterium]
MKKLKKKATNPHRLKPLSLRPLKAEEALSLFMQVDPVGVQAGMRRPRRKMGKPSALPTG